MLLLLAKRQHLPRQTAVGLRSGVLRRVVQNTHTGGRTFRHFDGLLNRALKHMKRLAVDFADCGPNALAELWAGLIHGQQDAGDFQRGIEMSLHCAYQFQYIGDTLAGEVVSLHRDNAVIRGVSALTVSSSCFSPQSMMM